MHLLTDEEGTLALAIARSALRRALEGDRMEPGDLPPIFHEKRGVFVTLKKEGDLRGCIGVPYPILPLGEALVEAAICSGLSDPRFPPIRKEELNSLSLEVTILSPPKRLDCPPQDRPDHVIVGKHGLIVKKRDMGGLLLPQVAEEYGWNSREFLSQTCQKAGLPTDCWQRPEAELYTFEGQIFHDKE